MQRMAFLHGQTCLKKYVNIIKRKLVQIVIKEASHSEKYSPMKIEKSVSVTTQGSCNIKIFWACHQKIKVAHFVCHRELFRATGIPGKRERERERKVEMVVISKCANYSLIPYSVELTKA